jgi:hypothetical protein
MQHFPAVPGPDGASPDGARPQPSHRVSERVAVLQERLRAAAPVIQQQSHRLMPLPCATSGDVNQTASQNHHQAQNLELGNTTALVPACRGPSGGIARFQSRFPSRSNGSGWINGKTAANCTHRAIHAGVARQMGRLMICLSQRDQNPARVLFQRRARQIVLSVVSWLS